MNLLNSSVNAATTNFLEDKDVKKSRNEPFSALTRGHFRAASDTIIFSTEVRHRGKNSTQKVRESSDYDDEICENIGSGQKLNRSVSLNENLVNTKDGGFAAAEQLVGDAVEAIQDAACRITEKAEEFVNFVWQRGCSMLVNHHNLPNWLKDNDYLIASHRPELQSFKACLRSVFSFHTETINIWTHLIGCLVFIGLMVFTNFSFKIDIQEKLVISVFLACAICCLSFSSLFHTFSCHSDRMRKLFSKLDYMGISILIIGSFVPWLYYAFYCHPWHKLFYLLSIIVLGLACIVVSLWDKFATPEFRAVRAYLFIALGLFGVFPFGHYLLMEGVLESFFNLPVFSLIIMATLYISGALIYTARIPERLFPGKCDIWFHSHQIFHCFVFAAAAVHYQGICSLSNYRLQNTSCAVN